MCCRSWSSVSSLIFYPFPRLGHVPHVGQPFQEYPRVKSCKFEIQVKLQTEMECSQTDHEHFCARVEGIDDHLALHWASDLHSAVSDSSRRASARPVTFPHTFCGRIEGRELPSVIPCLLLLPALQNVLHSRAKLPLQICHELQSLPCEDFFEFRPCLPSDAHSCWVRCVPSWAFFLGD